jgi:hypothetical protein
MPGGHRGIPRRSGSAQKLTDQRIHRQLDLFPGGHRGRPHAPSAAMYRSTTFV